MILSTKFLDINRMDEMRLVIDYRSSDILFSGEKKLNDNETIWVKIYSDGFVDFGLTMEYDPIHNCRYTWSSNAASINDIFELWGTPLQIARTEMAYINIDHLRGCYCSAHLLMSVAKQYAIANQDRMNYGFVKFCEDNGDPIQFVEPQEGIQLSDTIHEIQTDNFHYDLYIETVDGKWMSVSKLSDWKLKRTGQWSLRENFNTTL